jgi:hypothetical protein
MTERKQNAPIGKLKELGVFIGTVTRLCSESG